MAKTLQFICFWGFISIWFVKFGTYVGNGQKKSNELGDILKCQREEVTKLQEVLKAEQVLNAKQCRNLVDKLDRVTHYVNEMITSTKETTNKFGLVLGELHCVTRKLRILVQDYGKQEWLDVAAFQMNNNETFRELVDDLQCLWDAMHKKYLAIYPNSQHFEIPCIDFSMATFDEIESDEKALVGRLEKCLKTMPNDLNSEDYELAKYLLGRLQFELPQVEGGELDALEILDDVVKPVFLKQIGATGEVYKSSWLGLQCATKMLGVLPRYRKEARILASLGHPNLVKFICCGRFNETHEGNVDGSENVSRNLFIVMELMETSLSDLLKKQKRHLPYLVAIDVMHEIARGMCYLHDMHVAHLDVNPSNVLLSSVSRLAEFKGNVGYDFVKLTGHYTSKPEFQSKPIFKEYIYTLSTPKYMAPEMLYNIKKRSLSNMACPFPADVWSFGMTCSEILSLKEPFSDTNCREVLQKIKDCWRPKLPINCEELTMLIRECWIEDPSQRPTFSNICKRLATLKKKFIVGIYSNDIPQFDKGVSTQLKMAFDEKVYARKTQRDVVVGLESNLAKVKNHLKRVNILGLIGRGGIGKTTLARVIFDDERSTYDASCFIGNLKSKGSFEILCEILQNFGRDNESTWTLVDAQKIMRELLATKKVLLILDDPRDASQVREIIPEDVSCVNNGTEIIITTRTSALIENRVDVNGRVDVEELDGIADKKLFDSCVLVDGAELSPQLFDLRDKIIEKCNGLPLSLKTMGTSLRGKERIRSWERAFQNMKRGMHLVENERLWSTWMIGFDELENDEKNMFLDLACFLPWGIGRKKALRICTNYGASPNHVLDKLVDRSLVKIDQEGNLEMPDQFRDLGRMIAETFKEYLGTRIWKPNMIFSQIGSRYDKRYKKVEAICINEEILQWLRYNFKGMEDLDVSSLRLLMCERLTTLPEGLGNLTSLTTLALFECSSLTTLPEEMGNLTSLITLDLSGCSGLTTLPEGLGNLTSLITLDLSRCSRLSTLPQGLGNLTDLTILDLSGCSSMTTLPEGLENLTSLITLDLSGCSRLSTLPKGLGNLTNLTILDLSGCSRMTTLPEGLENLISLKTLYLSKCSSLTTLPEGLGNLIFMETLYLQQWSCLRTLPEGLGNLTDLTILDLSGCSSMTILPEGLENLISLRTLYLSRCSSLTTLPEGLGNLTDLTILDLSGCSSMTTLPEGLGNLTYLKFLYLSRCRSLETLPDGLGNLTSLTTLDLYECSSLTTLPKGLGNLTSLTMLDLSGCSSMTTLPKELGNLVFLTTLDLSWCSSMTTLPEELENLTSLKTLNLSKCLSLTTIPERLGNLTSLRTLKLSGCSSLTTIPKRLQHYQRD